MFREAGCGSIVNVSRCNPKSRKIIRSELICAHIARKIEVMFRGSAILPDPSSRMLSRAVFTEIVSWFWSAPVAGNEVNGVVLSK